MTVPPHCAGFDESRVPQELRDTPRWICWRYENRGGKRTKVPLGPASGQRASVSDARSWCSFEKAMEAWASRPDWSGIGFVFTEDDDMCGVDLDDCVTDNGSLTLGARDVIERLNTYSEMSPSGRGVKLFLRGTKPAWAKCRSKALEGVGEIEIYEAGRFFTVTSQRINGAPEQLEDRQAGFSALCAQLWSEQSLTGTNGAAKSSSLDDDEVLLARAANAKNGDKFKRLWAGDTSMHGDNDSAADIALCCVLAFWTGNDPGRIDRLFRRSGLYRQKWERQDYRERTIRAAIEQVGPHGLEKEEHRPPRRSLDLPEIEVDIDEHRVVDETVRALSVDEDLFTRGTTLARAIRSEACSAGIDRPGGSVIIADVPVAHLRERLTRAARFARYSTRQNEMVSAHPTAWLVNAVATRGVWPGLRELYGVSSTPFLRPDGSVCQAPGYDTTTGVLYVPTAAFEPVSECPSRDDALAALDALLEVVEDFKFESDAHKAAWLAGLLTPLARHAFVGPAPMFLVDANVRGAGKSLLCQVIAEIVLGRPMPVSSYAADAEEMRKKITSIAMAGDAIVLLDNLAGKFGCEAIDRALTATRWRDRVLGGNSTVDLPLSTVWYGTGNNVLVAADTARRIVHIRLDVLHERPEERSGFRHPNLIAWIREERARLLAAALTALVAFCRAGRPQAELTPMGSFEGWSALVRGCVVWLGLPDPCLGRTHVLEFADAGADAIGQLVDAWRQYDTAGEGFALSELLDQLYSPDSLASPSDLAARDLRFALEQFCGGAPGKSPQVRRLGNLLKSYRRRVIRGCYFDIDPAAPRRRGSCWRVFAAPGGSA